MPLLVYFVSSNRCSVFTMVMSKFKSFVALFYVRWPEPLLNLTYWHFIKTVDIWCFGQEDVQGNLPQRILPTWWWLLPLSINIILRLQHKLIHNNSGEVCSKSRLDCCNSRCTADHNAFAHRSRFYHIDSTRWIGPDGHKFGQGWIRNLRGDMDKLDTYLQRRGEISQSERAFNATYS